MLYPEIQNSGPGAVLLDISGHIIVLRKVLATQQSQLGKTLRIILDNRNASATNDAPDVIPPVIRLPDRIVNNRETGLIAFPDSIHFMPLKGRVKVDMAVDIDKINGNSIGISTFSDN